MQTAKRHRGAVLIVVLGVLVVLALMATSFAGLQQIERSIAKNYLDEVRARLVAQAGVEFAAGRVLLPFEQGVVTDPSMTYWGGNTSESGDIDWKTPLEYATNPSYAWEDETTQDPTDVNVKPLLLKLDGRDLGFSGTSESGTYAAHGDLYRLRIADANSMIHLNDGLENGPSGNVSKNLARILDNLCVVLKIPKRGQEIVDRRPLTGYRSKRDLQKLFSPSEYETIRPHVSIGAWQDPNVVNPVPLSSYHMNSLYPVPYNSQIRTFRYGRTVDTEGKKFGSPARPFEIIAQPRDLYGRPMAAVIAMDELNAQWIEQCSRAPVNVNLASREILTALLMDLRGFFVMERRKNNIASNAMHPSYGNIAAYSFAFHARYDNTPMGPVTGDEFGYLYATQTIDRRTAERIAEEMIACRSRTRSKAGIDYKDPQRFWFGGPFTSWRQFNAFCDTLVERGVLVDPRPIYKDFDLGAQNTASNPSFTGNDFLERTGSAPQARYAAQAIADVLKANFNPNCTLNELNPDANLFTIVDKTDLIVNSTEFCFTPMGSFEVESEGIVARPRTGGVGRRDGDAREGIVAQPRAAGGADLLVTREGHVVARKKIECILRAYTAVRHTTQADFYEGRLGPRRPDQVTNSNHVLELGPEPDNGIAAKECRWSGWIQLSTLGGHWSGMASSHAPGTMIATPPGSAKYGSLAHGHFSLDHRLCHHSGNGEEPLRFAATEQAFSNWPDVTEGNNPGPYGPTVGGPGRHRLARSYRLKGNVTPDAERLASGEGTIAVSDLRIDGAYVERDSSCMYEAGDAIINNVGTVSYWLKPAFHPGMTGRPRTFFSIDPLLATKKGPLGGQGAWDWSILQRELIHGQWFLPTHGGSQSENTPFSYWTGPWHSSSLAAGISTPRVQTRIDPGGGIGMTTRSLNHAAHNHARRRDVLKPHAWTHVTMVWKYPTDSSWGMSDGFVNLYVDGVANQDIVSDKIVVHPRKSTSSLLFGDRSNPMRLGEVSHPNIRNWGADATIDEFYVWRGDMSSNASELYKNGRYGVPLEGAGGGTGIAGEAIFTSPVVRLTGGASGGRELAFPMGAPKGITTVEDAGVEIPPKSRARVLAVAWTLVPELTSGTGVGARMKPGTPAMRDYRNQTVLESPSGADLKAVEVEATFLVNDREAGDPCRDESGSMPGEVFVTSDDQLRYQLRMVIKDADVLNTELHASPVIDDVTIYFTEGVQFESYEMVEIAL